MAHHVVELVETVEEEMDFEEIGSKSEYSAAVDILDVTLVEYSDVVADEELRSAVVDMVVAVVEMVFVVVVPVAVEGKVDHIENMEEVPHRPSLRRRQDYEGDSVDVGGCLCCFDDSQGKGLLR